MEDFGGCLKTLKRITRETLIMNKKELIEKLSERAGRSKADSADFLKIFIEVVADTLDRGEEVQVFGLGTFRVQNRAERIGRNPHTGEQIIIPACRKVTFKSNAALESLINHK